MPPELGERWLRMLNRVVAVDTTVGFAQPLTPDQGRAVVAELDEQLRAGRVHLLLGEDDAGIVGQLQLVPNRSPNNRHVGWVYRAMLDPDMRGIGLVRVGLARLIERCRELGIEVLCMDVRKGTPGELIWRHLGFEVFGVLPDYSRVDGHSADGLYMHRRVDDLEAWRAARVR